MSDERANPVRPLRIIDLMIITASMAVVFMMYEATPDQFDHSSWLFYPLQFFTATCYGIFLAALVWLPLQRVHTRRLFHHPGHWIIGSGLISTLGVIGFWAIYIWAVDLEDIDVFATENELSLIHI